MITSKCGFLDKISHGDLVLADRLADRGFDIAEDLGLGGASLTSLRLQRENLNCLKGKWKLPEPFPMSEFM